MNVIIYSLMDLENHIRKLFVFLILYIKVNYTQHTTHHLQDAQDSKCTTLLKDNYANTIVPTSTCAKGPYELDKDLHVLWDSHIY